MATTQTLGNIKTTANAADNFIDGKGSATAVALEAQIFYDKTLLKRLLPNLLFAQFAEKSSIPKHGGNKVNWRKFNSLSAATTPLTEGVTPSGNNLTMAQVQATLHQYGDFIEFSDLVDLVGLDPILTEGAEVLGEQAGLTIDTVMREEYCKGTNVQYAGGKTATNLVTATDVINAAEVKKMVRTLKRNNVKPFKGKYYVCVIDPDMAYDLQNDPDWKEANMNNHNGQRIYDGEIGELYGVKFIETTNLKVKNDAGASSADIHCALCFGKGAFGMADIESQSAKSPSVIVKPLGSAGSSDPLNQRQTEGWKTYFAATVLDNLAVVRLECAVTA